MEGLSVQTHFYIPLSPSGTVRKQSQLAYILYALYAQSNKKVNPRNKPLDTLCVGRFINLGYILGERADYFEQQLPLQSICLGHEFYKLLFQLRALTAKKLTHVCRHYDR